MKIGKEDLAVASILAALALLAKRVLKRSAKTEQSRDEPNIPAEEPEEPDDPGPPTGGGGSAPPSPIAVGTKSNPEVASLLAEMNAAFQAAGIDTSKLSAEELTLMPETPTRAHAIPPRAYWPRMIRTLVTAVQPLRISMGIPFHVRGYRPPDYNEAVGGSDGSRHQWFEAVDIYLTGPQKTSSNKRKLALEAAAMFLDRGDEMKMGFGAYGAPVPSNIHIDTGRRKRTWREAEHYISAVRAVS